MRFWHGTGISCFKINSMETRTKIFLVDDNVFSLSIYQQGLENLGYTDLSLFFDGTHCVDNLHQKPNIVFLDYNMDDMSGLEVLEKIRRYDPDIFVVIVSAQEDLNIAVNVLKHGAVDYIVKDEREMERMEEVINRIESLRQTMATSKRSILQKLLFLF
jgi:DNA-binding NtrC family response regulator